MSDSRTPVSEPTTYNLLFVCTGNTCRSAMAEAIARDAVHRRGWTHVAVRSAGTGAAAGSHATDEAIDVAREHGLDLESHRATPLSPEIVEWADLILVMSETHMWAVSEMDGAAKAGLLTDFLDGNSMSQPIEDPFGGDITTYRDTYAQLELAIDALLDRLAVIVAP